MHQNLKRIWALFFAACFYLVFGVLESGVFLILFKVHGYTYGVVPSLLIGLGIGGAAVFAGKEVGLWTGVLAGSLGNFFNVGTLSQPLPVDAVLGSLSLRLPALVAFLGGGIGFLIPIFLEKTALLDTQKQLTEAEPKDAPEE